MTLFVSSGPAQVTVPDVTGETEGSAKSQLQNDGFQVRTTVADDELGHSRER